jgi:hypothetical protein
VALQPADRDSGSRAPAVTGPLPCMITPLPGRVRRLRVTGNGPMPVLVTVPAWRPGGPGGGTPPGRAPGPGAAVGPLRPPPGLKLLRRRRWPPPDSAWRRALPAQRRRGGAGPSRPARETGPPTGRAGRGDGVVSR